MQYNRPNRRDILAPFCRRACRTRAPLAAVILFSIAFFQSALAQDNTAPAAGQQTAPVAGPQAPAANAAPPAFESKLAGAAASGAGTATPSAGEPSINIVGLPQDLSPFNPRNALALYARGLTLLKKGDTEASNNDISAAKAINPNIAEQFDHSESPSR
jgi:hypothetical protein